jgi:hypothetical protein
LIGVCSYLLIGYYTHRLSAVKAAQQAILVNRISDGMLLWGILWVWHHTGSLEYDLVNSSNASSVPVLLGVAILIGAMGKSAQVLFHVWLPNAMEGGLIFAALHFLWCILGICMFWYCFGSFCDLFAIDCSNLCRDLVDVAMPLTPERPMEQFVYSFATVVATNKLRQTTISDYQQQAICGLLLGDASLSDPNRRGVVSSDGSYRMEFTFKQASFNFTRWVKFQVLGNLATKSEPTPYPRQEPTQYTFSSSQFSYFTKLAVMWYVPHPNPTPRLKVLKILPPTEYLEQQFTAVALAFLIMSDGYWDNDGQTVYLCIEGFSKSEVQHLISLLSRLHGLKATTKPRGDSYRIRFSNAGNNLKHLSQLVLPYMHPSMLYKLNVKS